MKVRPKRSEMGNIRLLLVKSIVMLEARRLVFYEEIVLKFAWGCIKAKHTKSMAMWPKAWPCFKEHGRV